MLLATKAGRESVLFARVSEPVRGQGARMSSKALLGTVMMAALVGVATEASATPQFQLQVTSGTYDSGALPGTTGNSGLVQFALPNINGGGGNKFTSNGLSIQGAFHYDAQGT